jgi:hypothetical protein
VSEKAETFGAAVSAEEVMVRVRLATAAEGAQ